MTQNKNHTVFILSAFSAIFLVSAVAHAQQEWAGSNNTEGWTCRAGSVQLGSNSCNAGGPNAEGYLTVQENASIGGDLSVNGNVSLTGPAHLGSWHGSTTGKKMNTFTLLCSKNMVLVGFNFQRWRKDDGDKDRYAFQAICK